MDSRHGSFCSGSQEMESTTGYKSMLCGIFFTSPDTDTRLKGPTAFSVFSERHWQSGVNEVDPAFSVFSERSGQSRENEVDQVSKGQPWSRDRWYGALVKPMRHAKTSITIKHPSPSCHHLAITQCVNAITWQSHECTPSPGNHTMCARHHLAITQCVHAITWQSHVCTPSPGNHMCAQSGNHTMCACHHLAINWISWRVIFTKVDQSILYKLIGWKLSQCYITGSVG